MIGFLVKRLTRKPGLTVLVILSIALPTALLNCIPIFAGAVDRTVLREELSAFGESINRPPFSLRLHNYGTPLIPMSLSVAESALDTISHAIESYTGIPILWTGFQVFSINFTAQTPEAISSVSRHDKPDYLNFVYYRDLSAQIENISGKVYGEPADSTDDVVNVWLLSDLANRLNVDVGDTFKCFAEQWIDEDSPDETVNINLQPVTVSVAGIWQPIGHDATDYRNKAGFEHLEQILSESLLVTRADYIAHIEPRQLVKTHRVNWDLVLDIDSISPEHVPDYLVGMRQVLNMMKRNIPNILYDRAPIPPLEAYTSRERVLTAQLLSFSIPGFGFLTFFLALVSAIIARGHQRDTIALLSRGLSIKKLVFITTIEECMLFIVGYPLGISLAQVLARMMGYTRSFLAFEPGTPYPISILDVNIPLSIVALTIALCFRLMATVNRAKSSLVETERVWARPLHPPTWMHFGVDFLLILPTLYLWRQLSRAGSLAVLAPLHGEQVYAIPELVLVPALFLLTTSLLSIRLFPHLFGFLNWFAGVFVSPTMYLAMRHLTRRWQEYTQPLLLIIMSLGWGVYLSSMALSLDQWLADRMYYRVGADLSFSPFLDLSPSMNYGGSAVEAPVGGAWIPPAEEFLSIHGIQDVSRVGRYHLTIASENSKAPGRRMAGFFLALDRIDYANVAWYRDNLSPISLGGLMNQLADSEHAVLVPRSFLDASMLAIGDEVPVRIALAQNFQIDTRVKVAGVYDMFPTLYPDDGITFIGNLDFLTDLGGIVPEYDFLVKSDGSNDGLTIFRTVSETGVEAGSRLDAEALIEEARRAHEHVGMFGTLSLGFIAGLLLAGLALIVYRQASLQDRVWWMSVLHAIGITRSHLILLLILEHGMLLLYGAGVALGLGIWTSRIFVPYMRIVEGAQSLLPPMLPVLGLETAEWMIGIFLAILVFIESLTVVRAFSHLRLGRLQVFQ